MNFGEQKSVHRDFSPSKLPITNLSIRKCENTQTSVRKILTAAIFQALHNQLQAPSRNEHYMPDRNAFHPSKFSFSWPRIRLKCGCARSSYIFEKFNPKHGAHIKPSNMNLFWRVGYKARPNVTVSIVLFVGCPISAVFLISLTLHYFHWSCVQSKILGQ